MLRVIVRRKNGLVGNASFFEWGRASSTIKQHDEWQKRSWSSVRVCLLL